MLLTNLFSAEALRDRTPGRASSCRATTATTTRARAGTSPPTFVPRWSRSRPVPRTSASSSIFARENGLRVLVQGTGHNATPLGDLADVVLVRTGAMRGVEIDAASAASPASRPAPSGRTSPPRPPSTASRRLAGSAPDVGVVGYVVGGGLGWLGRRYGLACERVLSFDVVTADGRLVRADRDERARPLLGAARRRRLVRGDRRPGDGARPRADRDRRHDALRLGARPRGRRRPGASGRRPRPRRRRRRAGSCRSRTCRRCRSSCAAAAS